MKAQWLLVAGTAIAWVFTRGAVAFDGLQPISANLCGRNESSFEQAVRSESCRI
jgi:hypothetical protein